MVTTRFTERQEQNGFTLLEVLVAVSLIAVGLLAAAAMQGTAITANSTSNRLTVANMLAQQTSEEIISRNCSTVNNPYRETAFCDNGSYSFGNTTVNGAGNFSTAYTIEQDAPINGTHVQGLTRVDVVVTYMTGSTPRGEAARLTTYKSNQVVNP